MSLKLGIGSLIGAIAGVFLQSMIEKSTAKTILYLVVLFSGASILVRMWNEKEKQLPLPQMKAQTLLSLYVQNPLQTIWDS